MRTQRDHSFERAQRALLAPNTKLCALIGWIAIKRAVAVRRQGALGENVKSFRLGIELMTKINILVKWFRVLIWVASSIPRGVLFI